ncbi:hypothetical protein [Streptomyces cyaneus]|uniref:hypothetical protein n=1 Tax=Streptomyces cyaneus TaxID=1904 RepID=UPI000FF89C9E|nr:hypothetical protein [Streptomyces cyaneus]
MGEGWRYGDAAGTVTADEAARLLRDRISGGRLEAWLTSSSGRRLAVVVPAVVSNAECVMVVMPSADEDDPARTPPIPGPRGAPRAPRAHERAV